METLSSEIWDVVIAGTSLSQSLLALALSKTGLKVLHVDKNQYYGSVDAGLSLEEAKRWSESNAAQITGNDTGLGPSRAYTISLNPQIVFAKSQLLPALVSSQIHTQLEFQAVGPFFVLHNDQLQKIPSNREDVFADDALSVRDKRRLMNLLRYVLENQENTTSTSSCAEELQDRFKLPDLLWPAVQALTLSTDTLQNTPFDKSMIRLKRQLTSMGYFGPGLAAVMAKYGGNAEICQVACRAGAVGGGVYLLGQAIVSVSDGTSEDLITKVVLTDGTTIQARHVVGMSHDLPPSHKTPDDVPLSTRYIVRQTSVISQPLRHLFTPISENGPIPAVAVVLLYDKSDQPPIFLQIHSEETGECPQGQCLVYASTISEETENAQHRLKQATTKLISTSDADKSAEILWSFAYHEPRSDPRLIPSDASSRHQGVFVVEQSAYDIACDDGILDQVKLIWQSILGEKAAEYDFLRFEERKDSEDD